jgi:hypothetical protein
VRGNIKIPRKYTESRERMGAPGSILSRGETEPTNVAYYQCRGDVMVVPQGEFEGKA